MWLKKKREHDDCVRGRCKLRHYAFFFCYFYRLADKTRKEKSNQHSFQKCSWMPPMKFLNGPTWEKLLVAKIWNSYVQNTHSPFYNSPKVNTLQKFTSLTEFTFGKHICVLLQSDSKTMTSQKLVCVSASSSGLHFCTLNRSDVDKDDIDNKICFSQNTLIILKHIFVV